MADLVKTRQTKLDKISICNTVWIDATFFDDEKVSILIMFSF